MKTIMLCEDALSPETYEVFEAEDLSEFLSERFIRFPDTGRIYHKNVSQDCDVTPTNEDEVKRLSELEGPFYVVIYPGDPVTILVAVVAVAVGIAAAFLLAPQVPNSALRNTSSQSPNNSLSERKNQPRPQSRIPDIFGTVRSTPDLLTVPYRVFVNHQEVEYAYMCVGRGEYEIFADDVRDDRTKVSEIAGAKVEIFAPFTSPNSGDSPQLRIGTEITEPVYSVLRSNGVNGQTLRPPNSNFFEGDSNVKFVFPDEIQALAFADIDFTDFFEDGDTVVITSATYTGTIDGTGVDLDISVKFLDGGIIEFETGSTDDFEVGDVVTVAGAFFTYNSGANAINLDGSYVISGKTSTTLSLQTPENVNYDWNLIAGNFVDDETGFKTCNLSVPTGTQTLNLAGSYTVVSVSADTIALSNPAAVNTDWALLEDLPSGETDYISPYIATTGSKWSDPFIIEDMDHIFANYVANGGLFKDDGKKQYRFDVQMELEVSPVNEFDVLIGSPELFQVTVEGSSTSRSTRAATLKATPTFSGRASVRSRRVTDADLDFEGSVVDEVKWRDLYAMKDVAENDFGNVTTVHAVTYATATAQAVKDRKLNMDVTRKIPIRVSGSTFGAAAATKRADEILAFVCLDEHIGYRDAAEVDFDNIYDTIAEVEAYFGSEEAVEFSYTFDNENLSFEETVATIAASVFCTAYRQGSQIKLKPELATEDSTLLFNHRNKMPGSETRTVRFGNQDKVDGLEFEWIDPEEDALVTFYLPDNTAVRPRKVESVGVRNFFKAFSHAHRIWNKIQYKNTAVQFDALQEAELLVISDRILVANNTRPETQDGEVSSQNVLELFLSQKVTFEPGEEYVIFLQHIDGTVESIPVTAGTADNSVILERAPKLTLSLDVDNSVKAGFEIVKKAKTDTGAFLLTEREPAARMTSTVKAINYDFAYYMNEGLLFWVDPGKSGLVDAGPLRNNLTAVGSPAIVTDATRGTFMRGRALSIFRSLLGFCRPRATQRPLG